MANRLKQNLKDAVVILKRESVSGTTSDEMTRIFRCEEGPGLDPASPGATIRGHFLCNRVHGPNIVTIDGSDDIERRATPREITVAQM